MNKTSMDKWNIIVDNFNNKKHEAESAIQKLWEDTFSQIFNYSVMLGTLEPQKTYQIGNSGSIKPDIMLKKDNKSVCVVELKQETIPLDEKIETQLFSYLKQTKTNIGLVISDKIYLYAYEYLKQDKDQDLVQISFEKDNKDGELFVDLFSHDAFDEKNIRSFVKEKVNYMNNVDNIKKELTKQTVLDVLNDYFGKQYTNEEIRDALDSFEIVIKKKQNIMNGSSVINDTPTHVNKNNTPTGVNSGPANIMIDPSIIVHGGCAAAAYLKKLFLDSGVIDSSYQSTVAKLNKNGKQYWANPNIDLLIKNWCLILNDVAKREIHVFKIPANSIDSNNVAVRHDRPNQIDLEIKYNDKTFECKSSKIKFEQWFIKSYDY